MPLTRREFALLERPGERCELIDGELVSKSGRKRIHVITLNRMLGWLQDVFGERSRI